MEGYSDTMLASEERALGCASQEKGRENSGEVGKGGCREEGEERRDKEGDVPPRRLYMRADSLSPFSFK